MTRLMLVAVLFAVSAVLIAKAERDGENFEDEQELEELHREQEDERDPRPLWFSRRRSSRRRLGKTKATCCTLSGFWRNELKSCMYLIHHFDGTLRGQYLSDVGNPGGVQPLYGKAGTGKPTTFGFAVSWMGASATTWSGLYQSCTTKDTLSTTWILSRMPNGGCNNNWQAFIIGQDKFFRSPTPCMKV